MQAKKPRVLKVWLATEAFIALLILLGLAIACVIGDAPKAATISLIVMSAVCGLVQWVEWKNTY